MQRTPEAYYILHSPAAWVQAPVAPAACHAAYLVHSDISCAISGSSGFANRRDESPVTSLLYALSTTRCWPAAPERSADPTHLGAENALWCWQPLTAAPRVDVLLLLQIILNQTPSTPEMYAKGVKLLTCHCIVVLGKQILGPALPWHPAPQVPRGHTGRGGTGSSLGAP